MPNEKEEKRVRETFTWKTGTLLEKIAFVGSLIFLASAIVFLIFEFATPSASWPYIWFDLSIGLSFIGESLTHWRLNRRLALVAGLSGIIFTTLSILKIFGVLAV